MKDLVTLLAILFLSVSDLKSQLPSMPSPTAANLGLYGEIPVSEYTGTPNISIPLYEIKGKSITVPVSLNYHASGIRPEVHPGPTGLGWTLFAGGAITRTVRGGGPDENDPEHTPMGQVYGYLSLGSNSWLSGSDWKTSQISIFQNSLDCQYNSSLLYDIEADEFSFNFLGISGKFYFGQNGTIRVQSDRPLKISFDPTHYLRMYELNFNYNDPIGRVTFFHRAIRDFIITDEFGTRYYFGGKDAVEISDPISYGNGIPPDGSRMCVTSWFLTRIESADGMDTVTFTYERGPFISQLYKWQSAYSYNGVHGSSYGWHGYHQDGNFVSPVYLTEILSSNGTRLAFTYSESHELEYPDMEYTRIFQAQTIDQYLWLNMTSQIPRLNGYTYNKLDNIRWLKLDRILVSDGVMEPGLRVVDFHYYENSAERLFLDSLNIYGQTDSEHYSYGFTYKNRSNLRPYLQSITDHWGFDNGRGFTTPFSPSLRTPDPVHSQNGILSSMRYPTGGVTTFEYESHDYSGVVDNKDRTLVLPASGNAGGVRIRTIISQDGKGGGFTKEYRYRVSPAATVSSGVLNATPVYSHSMQVRDCGGSLLSSSHSYSTPVIPLTQWNDGRYISYTDVCERRTDNGSDNGYVRYTFTNHDNGHSDVLLSGGQYNRAPYPKNPHNSRWFERGKLLREYRYNAAGVPVYRKDITWGRYGSQGEDNARSMLFEAIADIHSYSFGYVSFACYLNYVYKFLPVQEEETVYDSNGANPVTKTTGYSYNSSGLERERVESRSDGSENGISTRYIADAVSAAGPPSSAGGCSGEAEAWLSMYASGMTGIPVETIEWTRRNGVQTFTSASYTQYLLFDNFPRPAALYRFSPATASGQYLTATLVSCPPVRYDVSRDSRLELEERYGHRDSYGNVMQYTGRDDIPVSLLWGYGGQFVIAEIRNATYDQVTTALGVAPESLSGSPVPNFNRIEGLRSHPELKNASITTFKYRPGVGLTESKNPSGLITTYEYDGFGRLLHVRDHEGKVIEKYEYNYAQ